MKKISLSHQMIIVACIAIAVVLVAVFLQLLIPEMKPCPLCIIQRYLYLSCALILLIGARFTWRGWRVLALLLALAGLGVALYHNWVVAHPGMSCGVDPLETLLNTWYPAQWLPFLFAADGLCSAATPPFFGLSIVNWSLVMMSLLTLLCALFVFTRRDSRS